MFFNLIKKIVFFVPLFCSTTKAFDCSGLPEKICSQNYEKCNWGGPLSGCMNRWYSNHLHIKWDNWKNTYNKNYSTIYEEQYRFKNFLENLRLIKAHKNKDYKLGLNHFADLSRTEWLSRFYKIDETKHGLRDMFIPKYNLIQNSPSTLDWRNSNLNPKSIVAVNSIKNQEQCGSCWAFSAIASVEGAWALAGHSLSSLSEQELVDCSDSEGNQGCNGGLMDQGFQYIIDNGGICSESEYPYKAQDGQCYSKNCKNVAKIERYYDIQSMNETAIYAAIQNGPISIAIEADQESFQFYAGGIYSDNSCGTNLDHGVNLVGYGSENGMEYWILRNSWGTSWGEEGYMRILRGKNICGLSQTPSIPVV